MGKALPANTHQKTAGPYEFPAKLSFGVFVVVSFCYFGFVLVSRRREAGDEVPFYYFY